MTDDVGKSAKVGSKAGAANLGPEEIGEGIHATASPEVGKEKGDEAPRPAVARESSFATFGPGQARAGEAEGVSFKELAA